MMRILSMMPKKCRRFSDDIMLHFFDLDADGFRPIRPKTIRIWGRLLHFALPIPYQRHRFS
jgi:hypothetical protein